MHDFRRAIKQWRALMRLLEPFIPDADRLRQEARDLARSLTRARDGQSALNAFDDLLKKGLVLSERSTATIRGRIEAIRGSQEQAVLTPELRDAIIAWIDATSTAIELGRSTRSISLRSPGSSPPAIAARGNAFRTTGRWPAPKICIICASAWSITATRWN